MFESKNSTDFRHIYESDRFDISYQNSLICLNQKILLVLGTFANHTVLIYYIKISNMFESKNSTDFRHIYKSDRFDILYQNFSCKTSGIIKKIRIEENLTTVVESWVCGREGLG